MSKIIFVVAISIVLLGFLAESSYSQQVTADLEKEITLNFSSPSTRNLTLTNKLNESLNFVVTINGEPPKSMFYSNNIFVQPNSTTNFLVTFSPEDIGRYNFEFSLVELRNSLINLSLPVKVWVQHPDKYILKDFTSSVEGNQVTASLTLKPHDSLDTEIKFDIFDLGGKVVKSSKVSKQLSKEEKVEQSIEVSDLPTGKYKLSASITGTNLKKETEFDIGLSRNVKEEKKVTKGLLYDEVKITLYNYGNLIENDYKVYEEIGKTQLVTLVTNASDIINTGDKRRYEFTIEKIRPGEVATIVYRFETWQYLMTTVVIIIIVVVVVATSVMMYGKPRIKKKFAKRSRGQYSVIIEVKNSKISDIKDVVVRDIVQPLLKVNKNETLGLAPHIRESQVGTELVWKVGNLKKGESRVLHYTLDSLIHAESTKLTFATLTYVTSRNRKNQTRSNELTLQ